MRLGVAKRGGILDCVRYDNSAVYRPRGLGGSKAERRLTISGGLTGAKRASDFIVGAIGKESLQECQVSSKESTHRGREHAIDTKILRLWHIDLDGDGSLEAYQWKARHQPVLDFQRVPHAGSTGKFLIKSCPNGSRSDALDRRLQSLNLRLVGFVQLRLVRVFLCGNYFFPEQLVGARPIRGRSEGSCFAFFELTFGLRQRGFEWPRIDFKKQIAPFD